MLAAGFGIKVAADFQQTTIAFEGILGSAEKARDMLGDLRDFAAKTPFELTGLAESAKNLLAVGFTADEIIPTMTTLGNVAATLGVGEDEIAGVVRALGQMRGKGRASAEELQQISEQIPGFSAIKAIAEDMGISTADAFKQMAKGAIPADQAIESILAGMESFPGASGAMERQSKTLNGVISTFKDTLANTAIDFITPYLPALSRGVTAVSGFLQTSLVPWLQTLIDKVGEFIDDHGPTIARVFGVVADALGRFASAAADVVRDGLDALSRWWDRNGDNVADWFESVGGFASDLGDALHGIGLFIWQDVLPALSDFAGWVVDNEFVFNTLKGAIIAAATAWTAYTIAAGLAAAATLLAFAPFIGAAVFVGALAAATTILADKFSVELSGAIQWIINRFADFLDIVKDVVKWLKIAVQFAEQLLDKLPAAKNNAKSGLGLGLDVLTGGLLSRDKGGPIPGPIGAPQLAIVHGGEFVQTPEMQQAAAMGGGDTINIFYPDREDEEQGVLRALRRRAALAG